MSKWTRAPLSRCVASLDAGVSVNAEDRPHRAGEIGVLKTSALSRFVFHPEQNKAVIQAERRLVAEPILANSILVSRMNTPALVGESCYVAEAHETLFLPDRVWQLKLRAEVPTNVRWLSYVLQSQEYRHYVEVHATGTSGSMKNLPKSALLSLLIRYPDAPEQRQIAAVLASIDSAIKQTAAIVEKLKQVKQGLLHDLLTRGVDVNGELRSSLPALIPLLPLSELVYVNPKTVIPLPMDAEMSFVPMGATSESGEITSATSRKWGIAGSGMKLFQDGDVLVAKITPCFENGKGGLARSLKNGFGFGSTEFHVLRCKLDTNPSFIHYWTISPSFRSQGESFMTGTAGQRRVMTEFFEKFLVPAFPFEEQTQIAQILDAQMSRINLEVATLQKLKEQKSGLMDDLLTGRVRVTPLLAGV